MSSDTSWLPGNKRKLVLVISGIDKVFPVDMPAQKGKILVADVDQPPGSSPTFDRYDVENFTASDWYYNIFVPHLAGHEEIFTVHPDRVLRRKFMQLALTITAEALLPNAGDPSKYAEKSLYIRGAMGQHSRFRDLAQEFHKPAILTFNERSHFSVDDVNGLLSPGSKIHGTEDYVEAMLRLCRSL